MYKIINNLLQMSNVYLNAVNMLKYEDRFFIIIIIIYKTIKMY